MPLAQYLNNTLLMCLRDKLTENSETIINLFVRRYWGALRRLIVNTAFATLLLLALCWVSTNHEVRRCSIYHLEMTRWNFCP